MSQALEAAIVLTAIFAPLVGAAAALVGGGRDRAGRAVTLAGTLATAAALGLLLITGFGSEAVVDSIDWLVPSRVSALLLLVVMGTATVVAGFSRRSLDDDGRPGPYFARIGVVASGSALVVVSGSPILLVAGWLVSGWALVGLIGFERAWAPAARAQRRILRTLMVGDVALLVAVGIAVVESDGLFNGPAPDAVEQLRASSILGLETLHVVMVLIVIAGASRSAMVPFQRWLIGTLAAPTPVSALVHAGLVSGAGLLLVRLAAPFVASDPAVVLAFALGLTTVVIASAATLLRSDVKGALAWSTVAQMAFMVVQCAVGAFSSAVFHIAGHGMYKASLFLGAGDTASSGLRKQRRPLPEAALSAPTRLFLVALISTAAVGVVGAIVPPDVTPAGEVLVFVFAWLTIASGVDGWLRRGPLAPFAAVGVALAGAFVSAATYLVGLRLAEAFVKPNLEGVSVETAIDSTVLIAALSVVGLVVAAIVLLRGPSGESLRDLSRGLVLMATDTSPGALPRTAAAGMDPDAFTAADGPGTRGPEVRADVARASEAIAPQWPLASFVAVNPLGGLESLGFDDATEQARGWLGARTHLSLDSYRRGHEQGLTRLADLRHVAHYRFTEICEQSPVVINGQTIPPVEIIVADLLHGPESEFSAAAPTAVQRRGQGSEAVTAAINHTVSAWLTSYVDPPHWGTRRGDESFVSMSLRLMRTDPRLRGIVTVPARAWIEALDRDPGNIIDASFAVSGVDPDERVDEVRAHLCQLPGWSGLAKWRNQWAQPDETRPPLAPIDVVAVRAALEACALGSGTVPGSPGIAPTAPEQNEEPSLDARVDAVLASLAPNGGADDRAAIAGVLSAVPAASRASMWLDAQERAVDARFLSMLDRLDPGPMVERPAAQVVFCIDVRSEGLRRQLEALGDVETLGFAGFFGVPMKIRRLGWDHHEARCPVLVSPAIAAAEHIREDRVAQAAGKVSRERAIAGSLAAHTGAKYGPGSPFALAETAGWFLGPAAAARTFLPKRSTPQDAPPTRMILDDDEVLLEQRTFFAESVLNTMGLTDNFAPIVMLCGHTSRTVNNPHATALECGACAGAAGDDNARAVAALLNSLDVRHGLGERGIDIPDDTWFVAGLHDTASDRVSVIDGDDIPIQHRDAVGTLCEQLERAGQNQSAVRSVHLPGPQSGTRDRGADWAQVRPEWGLARNAAFIIGPRSMTAGLDLEGRAFLHGYNADDDETGKVLETIMTAPLVVGHWISAQYYFSTVDPERFGAGNKLIHNPIGTTGVISGDGGDLRAGLPLQSTHVDGEPFHQPVRLLAIIQADLLRIENIIAKNPILQTLTAGSWLRIAARSQPDQRWSTRTPAGTWIEMPRAFDPDPTLTANTEMS